MKHELLLLGKVKDSFIEQGVQEYVKRLRHYTQLQMTFLKDKSAGTKNVKTVKDLQGKILLSGIPAGSHIVVLDATGKQFTSENFAKTITGWEMQGIRRVCYLIGGPDGHAKEVVNSANLLLSFSKMTFTHDMTRVLLLEQLYRAYTIKAGEKYHK